MREIKFRIWSNQYNEYIQDKDRYYISVDNGKVCKEYNDVTIDSVPNTTREQYTGLNDNNGVEIYEGDIVMDNMKYKYKVEWSEDHASFILRGINNNIGVVSINCDKIINCDIVKIGNMHENTELLIKK